VGLKRLILYIHLINIILQFEKCILENTKMNKTITNDTAADINDFNEDMLLTTIEIQRTKKKGSEYLRTWNIGWSMYGVCPDIKET